MSGPERDKEEEDAPQEPEEEQLPPPPPTPPAPIQNAIVPLDVPEVRRGFPGELAPHEAAGFIAQGLPPDPKRMMRRGRFKVAVVTTVALSVVFLELLFLSPGIAIAYGVIIAPLMVYLIRITNQYLENESSFRRGMAEKGTIVLAILGSWIFLFVSLVTIIWAICSGSHF